MHVGHCRGAILGDVIANILLFNKHKVTKEYYVNDYGNQISNFTKSVFLRIREHIYKESFPSDENLYPGEYIKDFAKNIISANRKLEFENFDKISKDLTILSINEALKLIKRNLESLGVNHDNFISERDLILNKEVEKVLDFLKKRILFTKEKLKPQ